MSKTILLVDDLKMFLEIERDFFNSTLARILTAKDGEEAIETIKTEKVDLVFMDWHMPKMDGVACCQWIKSAPQHRHIPVVLVSSATTPKDKEYCLAAGCDHFITKPAERDSFLDAARKFIPDIDRREKRVRYKLDCMISTAQGTVSCAVHDLSVEGAFVATEAAGTVNDVIQLCFSLPEGTKIECLAKILWVNSDAQRHPKGFGVKLALTTKAVKGALAGFLSSQK